MDTGEILWLAKGKTKQVVYDFIEHVGVEWMSHVEAAAMDMNSDFYEAFRDKCPNVSVVFDHFHLIKNFNEKVLSEIRKDEEKRLKAEGDEAAAKSLKRCRYIVTSNRETLKAKDLESEEGKIVRKGSNLFKTPTVTRKGGNLERYERLLSENRLLFTADIIKEKLKEAYACKNEEEMAKVINEIMDICEESGNKRLLWFKKLLYNHFKGITAYGAYKISSGKIEGINNKIKTARRQAYGYPEDEYFFLKLFDISRHPQSKFYPSHNFCD